MIDDKNRNNSGRVNQPHNHQPSRHNENNRPQYDRQGGGQGGRGGVSNEPASSEVHAPFNFVPLADKVVLPEWSAQVSQDQPLPDGVSGTLEFKLTAHTPLLIGSDRLVGNSQQPGQVEFFQLPKPDGRYSIPGSSLRGMLRNVLEIATFSRMRMVEDQLFSVRDMQNQDVYGRNMTTRSSQFNGAVQALSMTGWLRFESGEWRLYKCNHARVEQYMIDSYVGNNCKLQRCKSSREKYQQIGSDKLRLNFDAEPLKSHKHDKILKNGNERKLSLVYSKTTSLERGSTQGYIVVTGQPSSAKHMEFLFEAPGGQIELTRKVLQDFLFIHKETDEWNFLNKSSPFPSECGIPIFYLLEKDGKSVRAMGLAQMFKLAYKHSVHDMIQHVDKQFSDKVMDFVETLFGRVSDKLEDTLKGRVSFGYAVCEDQAVKPVPQKPIVLNTPKPSYYPIYVRQQRTKEKTYKTYMDDDATISGWKRYPVHPKEEPEAPQGDAARNMKIQTVLNPLPTGTSFTGKLRFHNVRPEELGALIWALTWGGNDKLFHALGMGKPFGFGRISISLANGCKIIPNNFAEHLRSPQEYQASFMQYMEKQVVGWANTPQLKQLCAMADPEKAKNKKLKYMVLGNGKEQNQFVNAKNRNNVLDDFDR